MLVNRRTSPLTSEMLRFRGLVSRAALDQLEALRGKLLSAVDRSKTDAQKEVFLRYLGWVVEYMATGSCGHILPGIPVTVRHSTDEDDRKKATDVDIVINGYKISIDVTISKEEYRRKLEAWCPGRGIPVYIGADWPVEKMRETLMREAIRRTPRTLLLSLL